jgi:hypothetical protein
MLRLANVPLQLRRFTMAPSAVGCKRLLGSAAMTLFSKP